MREMLRFVLMHVGVTFCVDVSHMQNSCVLGCFGKHVSADFRTCENHIFVRTWQVGSLSTVDVSSVARLVASTCWVYGHFDA